MSAAVVTPIRLTSTLLPLDSEWSRLNERVQGRYVVRLARSGEEVDAALRLRFQVFNLECVIGAPSSFAAAKDMDAYDSSSHHLIVIERDTLEVIATCRLRTHDTAKTIPGFCLSRKFDLCTLPIAVVEKAIEVDRLCVAKPYRHSSAFWILLKALDLYAMQNQKTYVFGSLSMSTQDPLIAGLIFDYLSAKGLLHKEFRIKPRPGFKCLWYKLNPQTVRPELPGVLRTHLRLGGRLLGLPAIDRESRTIDFPVLLDLKQVNRVSRSRRTEIENFHVPLVA